MFLLIDNYWKRTKSTSGRKGNSWFLGTRVNAFFMLWPDGTECVKYLPPFGQGHRAPSAPGSGVHDSNEWLYFRRQTCPPQDQLSYFLNGICTTPRKTNETSWNAVLFVLVQDGVSRANVVLPHVKTFSVISLLFPAVPTLEVSSSPDRKLTLFIFFFCNT